MVFRKILYLLFIVSIVPLRGQSPERYPSGTILQKLEKLNTLGSVLYVAAHPDDENTQLIAYYANDRHYRAGYLSATRGDGGQNLIGPEIREALGIIRTQELLAARRIDGGVQFFSRANDFGYSKHSDETFDVWDRGQVLADFVWAIRKFRPDVIITRFNTEPGTTHGHHTASAILAKEAFHLSGDSTAFPDQLQYVSIWQPAKLFWNIGLWSYRRSGKTFDASGYLSEDVGAYNPYLGYSYTEMAAKSRSMHKSQGFGNTGTRGSESEYFQQWEGEQTEDLFGGINTTWTRIPGSEKVAYFLNEARLNFDPAVPYAALPDLLNARKELLGLSDQHWKELKLKELNEVIQAVTGTYMEAVSDDFSYTKGDSIFISLELINRSPADLVFHGINYSFQSDRIIYNLDLEENQKVQITSGFQLPEDMNYTHPYWLEEPGTEGMYQVSDQQLTGLPENPPLISAFITLKAGDQFLDYEVPVVYKRNDPVDGEVYRPLELVPDVMLDLENKALVFGSADPRKVPVRVIAGKDQQSGKVWLEVPDGWKAEPPFLNFEFQRRGEDQVIQFLLSPPAGASVSQIAAKAEVNERTYDRGIMRIAYDHIPVQTLFPDARTKVVKLDLDKRGRRIGYIMGAGDEVPFSLEQIGYEVTLLERDEVQAHNLQQFDAVILGIRAFNTLPWLAYRNQELFEYVKGGGNVIVQYNTSHALVTDKISPLPLKLSRDRVAVEGAPVTILEPGHPVLNFPNKITRRDFEGWVQERGLYFPDEWASDFVPVFSSGDPGEDPSSGLLLIAKYGKGYYCYTGLSFFRELPAGVPGAYRLLANMIALGKHNELK